MGTEDPVSTDHGATPHKENADMKPRLALTVAVAGVALAATACGSSSTGAASTTSPSTSSSSSSSSSSSTSAPAADANMANLVGSGCAAYAKAVPAGKGSVVGMAADPVATAASNNPLLKTLVAAVSGKVNPSVNLVPTLNNGGPYTVFAPIDSAFAKIPAATLDTLAKEKGGKTLSTILTYHVLPGSLTPDMIDGTHKTVQGGSLTVAGSGDNITVNGTTKVVCGGVKTANATVYLIDSVLMPKM
jgi:uncharacterized surface protein with fasciclin (FAS1) repeats